MLKIVSIIFCLISIPMFPQVSIKGSYNYIDRIFNTDDKIYWIDFFKNGVAKISNGGLMGLMDTSGKVLCTPQYDIIYDFQNGVAIIGLNGKFGLININGEELATPQFEIIEKVNQNLFLVKVNSKYSILKNNGSFLSEIKYSQLQITRDKDIIFYNGEDIGFIDLNTGKELPVFKHKKEEHFANDIGLEVFRYIRFFHGYKTNPVLEYNDGLTITYEVMNNAILFGFMDKSFKTVIRPQYEWVEPFKNGYSLVLKNNNWGVIDKTGKSVLPIEFESIQILDNQKFLVFKDGKYGVLDNCNNIIIPLKYISLFHIENNLYASYNGEKWGVINEKERLILNYEYDGVTNGLAVKYESAFNYTTSSSRAILYFKGYYFDENGLLDKENIRISKFVEGLYDFSKNPEGFIPYSIESDNGHKIQNYDYEEVINDQFKIVGNKITEEPKIFSGAQYGRLPYYLKGITNSKKEIVIPLIYDDIIQQNGSNIFIVKKDNKYGVINIENKFIINLEYDYINIIGGVIITQNIIIPHDNIEVTVFDFTGKMILPPIKNIVYKEGSAGALMTDNNIIDKRKL